MLYADWYYRCWLIYAWWRWRWGHTIWAGQYVWYITAKGLFDEPDEEKESSAALRAAITGKKSTEEPSEDADNESLHSSSKWTLLVSDVC